MSEQNKTNAQNLFAGQASDVTKQITEKAVDRLLNGIFDFVDTQFKHAMISLRTVYEEYLINAYKRYNSVTTLINRHDPRPIIGNDNLYIHANLSYKGKTIETYSVKPLLRRRNNILICGTGGIGKTMMLRYFFLNEIIQGDRVPILLTMRRVNNIKAENMSIIDLVYMCMEDYNVKLPREQFEYSLEKGIYLFLLDGFDEVVEAKASRVAEEIQRFCSKYPKNYCIMTSRPEFYFSPLETFTRVDTKNLSEKQAVTLAGKFANSAEEKGKVEEFCEQLKTGLYLKYESFAKIPLLLCMMYLTFLDSGNIPNNIADFYERTFDALINTHDSFKKPDVFVREFKCTDLDRRTFKMIFAHFCYRSFFDSVDYRLRSRIPLKTNSTYDFRKKDIEERLSISINKMNADVSVDDYLLDLQRIVCLIIQDGPVYRFVHRSFQDYFAAVYTEQLNDNNQKKVFHGIRYESKYNDYFRILYSIQKNRLITNGFLSELKDLIPMLKENDGKDAWRRYFFSGLGYNYNNGKGYFYLTRRCPTNVDIMIAYLFEISNYNGRYESTELENLLAERDCDVHYGFRNSFDELERLYPGINWGNIYEDIENERSFEIMASIVREWVEDYNEEKVNPEVYFPD